jgi:hypothetical protein
MCKLLSIHLQSQQLFMLSVLASLILHGHIDAFMRMLQHTTAAPLYSQFYRSLSKATRPDGHPRQTMSLYTAVLYARYSKGSHRKRCVLRSTHWSSTEREKACSSGSEGDIRFGSEGSGMCPLSVCGALPSGKKVSSSMYKCGLFSLCRHAPVAVSHTRTVLS